MTDFRTLHSMLIEMHGGMLTLAAFCTFAMVITRFHQRMRRKCEWYGIFWVLDGFFEKLARYAEPTSYLATIAGFTGLVVSSIVGYYAWPAEVLMNHPLSLNKIMVAIFSAEFWAMFLMIRSKFGENLWKYDALATLYVCTGFAGFFFMVLTGSLGGHMAGVHSPGKGSVLDPIYDLLGIRTDVLWLDTVTFLILAFSNVILILLLLYIFTTNLRREGTRVSCSRSG